MVHAPPSSAPQRHVPDMLAGTTSRSDCNERLPRLTEACTIELPQGHVHGPPGQWNCPAEEP